MSSEKILVLNVDDYDAGRYATSRILKQAGFAVVEAETGREALDVAQRERPDLIVLDINLPDMDGFEVCRRLKDDPNMTDVPVLQMSASYLGTENRIRGLEGGADAYVTQPAEPRELIATVNSLLRVRQAQAEVRFSEQRFRALVESFAELVWRTDGKSGLLDDSPEWRAFTGQTVEEIQGDGWLEALHPQDRESTVRVWQESVRHQSKYEATFRLRAADGTYHWVESRGTPVFDADGNLSEWVGVCINVDRRRRAEESERYLADASTILSTTLDYGTALNQVANLLVPAVADWCAIDVVDSGVIRRVAAAHVDPSLVRLIREAGQLASLQQGTPNGVSAVLQTGVPEWAEVVQELDLEGLAGSPEVYTLHKQIGVGSYIIAPLIARGQSLGTITFATAPGRQGYTASDLVFATELARRTALAIDNARLYQQALAGSSAKSEFLAVMSHELRTPLNAIIGYTDLLTAEIGGQLTGVQQKHVTRIDSSARHLLHLIEAILRFSRIEAGEEQLELADEDLSILVRETVELVEPLAVAKNLAIEVEVTRESCPFRTDPGKVRQIILNLLSNAVKFTEEGRITISLKPVGSHVTIDVEDTGPGIAPEQLEQIFEPFRQVVVDPGRRASGTGLGLTVSRRLAEMLGGTLTAVSHPGRGSRFTVRLPREIPSEA